MSCGARRRRLGPGITAALFLLVAAVGASAQERLLLRVQAEDGSIRPVPLVLDRGYAAVAASTLEGLGWNRMEDGDLVRFSTPGGTTLVVEAPLPFFTLEGELLQLAQPPYLEDGDLHIPLQILTDFLPRRYPERYAFDGPSMMLRAGPPPGAPAAPAGGAVEVSRTEVATPAPERTEELLADTLGAPRTELPQAQEARRPAEAPDTVAALTGGDPPAVEEAEAEALGPPSPLPEAPSSYEGPRVVVIDAGHGGYDPGSIGISGVREKNVVLGVATALADALGRDPGLEVHLLRDDDTFIELWDRGQLATDLKGDRPGIFISIHANSFPQRRSARGFETYFLSEARTDHERRVAAIENAPMQVAGAAPASGEDLDFILRELRNLDHQHWSALLAENIQEEMERVHPGPNRGVKQGPLAVITNALMPSVLVELGYLSNAQEERLLARGTFQRDAAGAIARAVSRFFHRYPPGSEIGGDGASR